MNEVENTAESNEDLNRRATCTNNGAKVGLVGVPLCDMSNIDKLLLDQSGSEQQRFCSHGWGDSKQLQTKDHV